MSDERFPGEISGEILAGFFISSRWNPWFCEKSVLILKQNGFLLRTNFFSQVRFHQEYPEKMDFYFMQSLKAKSSGVMYVDIVACNEKKKRIS